jgi:hypothetical protein
VDGPYPGGPFGFAVNPPRLRPKASAATVLFCPGGMLVRTHNRAVDEVVSPRHFPVMLGILLQGFPCLLAPARTSPA